MKLRRLEITHLPGYSGEAVVEGFGAGITVVTGPNASGKSSLIRALRHLIDETPDPAGGALTLAAEFESRGTRLTVTRAGSDIVWQGAGGERIERPPLPRGDFLQCYWLSLNDLLDEGATDAQIRANLRRALSGGFDLDGVRRDPRFHIGAHHGRGQQSALRRYETALQRVLRDYEALDQERQRRPQLEAQIKASAAAAARADKTEQALKWLEARRDRHAFDEQLEAFAPEMDRLTGQEAKRLRELEARRDALVSERDTAVRDEAAAEAARERTGIASDPPQDTDLEIHGGELERAAAAEQELEQVRKALAEARGQELSAREALGGDPVRDGPGAEPHRSANEQDARNPLTLSPDAVDEAVLLAESLRATERRLRELEAMPVIEPGDENALATLATLAGELRRWLRQPEPGRFRLLLGASIAALAAALGAALVAGGNGQRLAATLAALAAVGSAAALVQLVRLATLYRARAEARARIAELPVAPPHAWTPEAVTARLAVVEDETRQLTAQLERAREAARRAREIEPLREEWHELSARKAALAQTLGFDPTRTAEGVARFASLAATLDRARAKVRELQLLDAQRQKRRDELAASAAAFLERYGARRDTDDRAIETLRAQLRSLTRRVHALQEADRTLADSRRTRTRVEHELAELDRQVGSLFDDAAIERGDRDTLFERCERLDAYRKLRRDRDAAMVLEQERRKQVIDDETLVRLVDDEDEPALNERLAELRLQAGSLDAGRRELAELEARLEMAGTNRSLERAQHDRDDALDELRKAYDDAMRADAGLFLLDDVAAEYRHDQEPPVLAAARERFARYTNNRYRLDLEDDGRIVARDNERGHVHSLDTLSTGTRMQLLMAVRLAWTKAIEHDGEPLPIFLDEALTTSDPLRFTSIARNLKQTADEEGRQIVYLSAEPADVVRWARSIGETPAHIELAASGRAPEDVSAADYRVAERDPVPGPDGMTAEEYAARLRVPRVDPRADAGEIHIFHLLRDDLDLLHALLRDWRTTRLGSLEALLSARSGAHAIPDTALRERLLGRCRAARSWIAAWRQGRGRPVDRNVLEASGAVSKTFIDSVTEAAAGVGGDAQALIDALENGEVARFQRNKIAELADWFAEHGHLDDADVLDADGREQRVLRECAPSGARDVQFTVAALEASAGPGRAPATALHVAADPP